MIDIWRTAKLLALDHKRFQTTGKSLGLLEASKHTARTCYCCLLWLNLSRQKCKKNSSSFPTFATVWSDRLVSSTVASEQEFESTNWAFCACLHVVPAFVAL